MPAHIKRDYGLEHKRRKAALRPLVATGTVRCVFADTGECKYPDPLILPGQRWQLDHTYSGPAHARCNMSAGAAYGNRLREPRTDIWPR